MKVSEILFEMTYQDAAQVFRAFGVDVSHMTASEIKNSRNDLLRRFHPDLGGDVNATQMINVAYNILKNTTTVDNVSNSNPINSSSPQQHQPLDQDTDYSNRPNFGYRGFGYTRADRDSLKSKK